MALSGCVPNRVRSDRSALRGLLSLRATSLAGSKSLSQSRGVGLSQGLASANSGFCDWADSCCCVDFLSLGHVRDTCRLLATAFAAGHNESTGRGVGKCVALLGSGNWAQRSSCVVDCLSGCDVLSRLSRGRNPARRRGLGGLVAASLARGNCQCARSGIDACVSIDDRSRGTNGCRNICHKGGGSVRLSRRRRSPRAVLWSPAGRLDGDRRARLRTPAGRLDDRGR